MMAQVQPRFTKYTISDTLQLAKKLFPADIDRDSDIDVVAAASSSDSWSNVVWYENNGSGSFLQHTLSSSYSTARCVCAGDLIPGDFLEIVAGSQDGKRIVLWQYSAGNWVPDSIGSYPATNNYSLKIADLDNDGFLDILASYGEMENRLVWFKGDGLGNFIENDITTITYTNAVDIAPGFINGDNFMDILGSAFLGGDDVSWWQNDGTPLDGGWIRHGIQNDYIGANSVELVDIDSDGIPDALAAAWGANTSNNSNNKISWWKNDGSGNFGAEQVITSNFWDARNAKGIDIDGDGDTDVVGAADGSNTISWFENNGLQQFLEHIITNNFSYAYYNYPLDFDGDGDTDVLASAQNANEIAWFVNDQEDDQMLASGDIPPVSFWNGNVEIDFSSSNEQEQVTVFYNAGTTPQQNALGMGIDHIAQRGFYTITTLKTDYTAALDFYYGRDYVGEWSAINTPGDLVICLWNDAASSWEIAGSTQNVDESNQKITVTGITSEFHPFSKWTLGSTSPDNSLPVQLYAFNYQIVDNGVNLEWKTASEIENAGFELWRASKLDSQFVLLSDYKSNDALRGLGNSNTGKSYAYRDNSVILGNTYYYKLVDVDFNNRRIEHEILEVTVTGFEGPEILSTKIGLGQNYPNPFNMNTTIPVSFGSRGTGGATLVIYNLLGQEIRRFEFDNPSAGINKIQWNGLDRFGHPVASGTYVYRLIYDGLTMTKKLLLLK
ncbi:MAG: FG-GAP-like repeat-containing protein [Calditrichia bacterium]